MIDIRQNKAFALTFTLIFMFLVISFMTVFILVTASGVSEANRVANEKRAYYVADAGLADAYERITKLGVNAPPSSTCVNPNIPSTCTVPYIPSATTDNGVDTVGNAKGSYIISVILSNNPRTNYIITSTGTYGNTSVTLQLKIIGAAISKFAYWSTTESNPIFGGPLWWVGEPGLQMLTNGPVQTNGQLNIFGNPVFNGPVTESNLPVVNGVLGSTPTSNSPNYYPGVSSNPNQIFLGGIQNQAPAINLPPQPTLSAINATAVSGSGLILTGASTVIFNPSGTITVTGKVKNSNCSTTTTYNNTVISPPANGVIYVQSTKTIPNCNSNSTDGNVTVQGTVKGQLTVAADNNVYLSGSVAYNTDPRINPASTDMLGLVANQNITVVEATAPTHLEVAGVLEALEGSFQVDQYWVYRGNSSTAVMDQYGSLINYVCGATGEMNMSGTLLGGWNQVQSYDNRLATVAPPGFPPYVNNSGYGVYNKYMNPQAITECVAGVCG